ncbi:histone deacetylase, partial [Xanthomonas translucens DAR61454]
MLIYTHPACLGHEPGPEHPERPERLQAVTTALREAFPDLEWREAPLAKLGDLARVHERELIDSVLADIDGKRVLDVDTALSPGSRAAALRAAGAGLAAVDAVLHGATD